MVASALKMFPVPSNCHSRLQLTRFVQEAASAAGSLVARGAVSLSRIQKLAQHGKQLGECLFAYIYLKVKLEANYQAMLMHFPGFHEQNGVQETATVSI
jgi:hypothetical protein